MRAMTRRRRALIAGGQAARRIDALLLPRAIPTGVLLNQTCTISVNGSFQKLSDYSTFWYAYGSPADRLNQLGVSAGSFRNTLYIWYTDEYVSVQTTRNIYTNTNYATTLSFRADSIRLEVNNASSTFWVSAKYNGGEIYLGDAMAEDSGGTLVLRDAQITKGNVVVYSVYPVELNGKYGIYDEISGQYVWL